MKPSGQPTSQPTGQPTSQPTMKPSTQPRSQPSGNPTWQDSEVRHFGGQALCAQTPALGYQCTYTKTFENLGIVGRQLYLTAYIANTGIGPSTQEFVKYKVNGHFLPLGIPPEQQACTSATVPGSTIFACDDDGVNGCFYNEDISDILSPEKGGSMTLVAQSSGVAVSLCPRDNAPVYVNYTLSYNPVGTDSPTFSPTNFQIAGNFQLNLISASDTGWLLTFLAINLGTFGIYAASLRVGTKVYPMKLHIAGFRMAQVATELSSLGFLLVTIFRSKVVTQGYLILGGRFAHVLSAVYLYAIIFGPKWLTDKYPYTRMLERQHMAENSSVYGIISLLGFIDTSYFFFYPWLDSPFSRVSFGYPDLHTFRICEYTILITAASTLAFQFSYLNSTTITPMEKTFFELNIVLQVLKIFLSTFGFLIMGDPDASTFPLSAVQDVNSRNPMQVEEGSVGVSVTVKGGGGPDDAASVAASEFTGTNVDAILQKYEQAHQMVESLQTQINVLQQDASVKANSDAMVLTLPAMEGSKSSETDEASEANVGAGVDAIPSASASTNSTTDRNATTTMEYSKPSYRPKSGAVKEVKALKETTGDSASSNFDEL